MLMTESMLALVWFLAASPQSDLADILGDVRGQYSVAIVAQFSHNAELTPTFRRRCNDDIRAGLSRFLRGLIRIEPNEGLEERLVTLASKKGLTQLTDLDVARCLTPPVPHKLFLWQIGVENNRYEVRFREYSHIDGVLTRVHIDTTMHRRLLASIAMRQALAAFSPSGVVYEHAGEKATVRFRGGALAGRLHVMPKRLDVLRIRKMLFDHQGRFFSARWLTKTYLEVESVKDGVAQCAVVGRGETLAPPKNGSQILAARRAQPVEGTVTVRVLARNGVSPIPRAAMFLSNSGFSRKPEDYTGKMTDLDGKATLSIDYAALQYLTVVSEDNLVLGQRPFVLEEPKGQIDIITSWEAPMRPLSKFLSNLREIENSFDSQFARVRSLIRKTQDLCDAKDYDAAAETIKQAAQSWPDVKKYAEKLAANMQKLLADRPPQKAIDIARRKQSIFEARLKRLAPGFDVARWRDYIASEKRKQAPGIMRRVLELHGAALQRPLKEWRANLEKALQLAKQAQVYSPDDEKIRQTAQMLENELTPKSSAHAAARKFIEQKFRPADVDLDVEHWSRISATLDKLSRHVDALVENHDSRYISETVRVLSDFISAATQKRDEMIRNNPQPDEIIRAAVSDLDAMLKKASSVLTKIKEGQ